MPDNLNKIRALTASIEKNEAEVVKQHMIDETIVWEEFYNLLAIPICIASVDSYFKKVNNRFCDLLGQTREQLLSHPYIYFVHPDDMEELNHETARIGKNEMPKDFTNRYRKSDGEYIKLRWTAATYAEGLVIATVDEIK